MTFSLSVLKRFNRALCAGSGILLTAAVISACSGERDSLSQANGERDSTPERRVQLNGSGASFPFPIYSKWFKDFSNAENGIRVDYRVKGSGAGIQDFVNGAVDFAASDAAMSDDEIAKVKQGVVLLPMTAGEIVLAYNLEGIESLKLPRDIYPEIFLGKIDRWNHPKIAAANPGVELPNRTITVVTRSDSSGTTYVFTGHLSAINSNFKSAVGHAMTPNWPSRANFVKAPKNDGVAAQIKQTPGAIGYIEYGFAKLTNLQVALLENQSGNFTPPGPEAGTAALARAEFPTNPLPGSEVPNLIAWVSDPTGDNAYPIVSFTWLLVHTGQEGEKAAALQKLVNYMLSDEAQGQAYDLGYIPLPENVRKKVREAAEYIN